MNIESLVNDAAELNGTHGINMDAAIVAIAFRELAEAVKHLMAAQSKVLKTEPAATEQKTEPEPKTEPAAAEQKAPSVVTLDDLRKAVAAKAKTHRDVIIGILARYDAKTLPELPETAYTAVLTEVEALR